MFHVLNRIDIEKEKERENREFFFSNKKSNMATVLVLHNNVAVFIFVLHLVGGR